MQYTRSRHRRIAAAALPAVLLALVATGCGSTPQPPAGSQKIAWSTVCHGQGGADMRALLSNADTGKITETHRVVQQKHALTIDQRCMILTADSGINVYVTTELAPSARELLKRGTFAPPSPAPKPFSAGEGANVWPNHAQAVLTCRQQDGKPAPVLVDVGITGSSTGVGDRVQLMEHLVRTRVAQVRTAAYCGAAA